MVFLIYEGWSSPYFDRAVLSAIGARRKSSHTTTSSNAERVEIFPGIKRRRCSVDEKLRIVQEASRPEITISYVVQQPGISPSLLFQ
jgi:transposase-like protein